MAGQWGVGHPQKGVLVCHLSHSSSMQLMMIVPRTSSPVFIYLNYTVLDKPRWFWFPLSTVLRRTQMKWLPFLFFLIPYTILASLWCSKHSWRHPWPVLVLVPKPNKNTQIHSQRKSGKPTWRGKLWTLQMKSSSPKLIFPLWLSNSHKHCHTS